VIRRDKVTGRTVTWGWLDAKLDVLAVEMWSRVKRWWAGVASSAVAVFGAARRSFLGHRARRFGAGLAYYALFALIPTLFLAVTIAAALFGTEATEGRLVDRLDGIVGEEAAEQIEEAVAALWENSNTSGFAIVTLVVVVYSASILFVAWRDTLEDIWELPYRSGLKTTVRSRVYGALVPLGAGILLSAIVIVELLAALAGEFITAPLLDAIIRAVEMISPTVASVLALGLVYRVSTRLRPPWRDIWPGTIVAALALAVLAWGYGLYVRIYGSSSAAGAASTIVLGLVFVYYSAQILLYGAEVINASADHRGRPLRAVASDPGEAGDSAEPDGPNDPGRTGER
jgi:membrane protein